MLGQLVADIQAMGMPMIHNYSTGFYYDILPDHYEVNEKEENIVFKMDNNQGYFRLSFLDAYIKEIRRPDMLIVDCKKCYRILQNEIEESLGFIYWTKIE